MKRENPVESKNFYIVEEALVIKKVFFYKKDGRLSFIVEGDEAPSKDYEKVGEVVYTLLKPDWRLKNHIRSLASSSNMVGISAIDPYLLNGFIVQYLLRDWSMEKKFKLVKDSNGFEMVEDVLELTGAKIDPSIFDAIIHLYNRFLA